MRRACPLSGPDHPLTNRFVMKVLVFGAGVIGRIYAGRLLAAGHDVSVVCRSPTAEGLALHGIVLARNGGAATTSRPRILDDMVDAGTFDFALVAIRRDQVRAAMPELRQIRAGTIVSLIDLPRGVDELFSVFGGAHFVPAFPGVAGTIRADGVVDYLEVSQQPTTIGFASRSDAATGLFHSAGFATAHSPDMRAWLQTHAIFLSAFESAIVASPNGAAGLGANRVAMRNLVLAVREGLRALEAGDVPTLPLSVRAIFLAMPVWFAVRYWSRQLEGPLGVLGMQPHSIASRRTELPALQRDVRAILHGHPMPRLDSIFLASLSGGAAA
jgi:2-dehydropantoate 2-reductase